MRRIYGVYLILIIMLFPAMLLYDDSSPYGISAIDSTIISDVEVSQILTDPDLIHQTSYNISGNSGEFSYSHYHILDSYNGVSALEFNHVANTTLVQGAGYPEEDFVFITQEFEWPYEMLPTTAIVKYTATTEMTGDFATYSTLDNRRMLGLFQIYIIDSLGNWEICQNNYLPFESYYDTYSRDIAGVIDETWDGLIEDQHGVQEDPQDILKVAFVLKPSYHFFEGPSETLSGSIIVKINNVGLVVSRSIEIDEIRRLSPVWKTSWNQFDLNEENGDYYQHGLRIGPNDSVYTFGRFRAYFDNIPFERGFITKWDADQQWLWSIQSGENTSIRDMVLANDSVYTVGTKYGGSTDDVEISRYSLDGDLLWSESYDIGEHEYGLSLGVDSESNCYVGTARFNGTTGERMDPYVIKVDSERTLIAASNITGYPGYPQRLVLINDTNLYTVDSYYNFHGLLTWWTSECERIADVESIRLIETDGVYLYTMSVNGNDMSISKLNPNLTREWSLNVSITYRPDYQEEFNLLDMKVDSDGSLVALVHLDQYAYEYRLYKVSHNGTLEWNKLIGPDNARFNYHPNFLALGSNGLAYVTGVMRSDEGNVIGLEAYIYGNYTPLLVPDLLNPLTLSVMSVGILAIVTLVVIARRRGPNKM